MKLTVLPDATGLEETVQKVVEERSKIRLDIGCGPNKKPGWVGMDIRPLEGVDVVHNILDFPWPFPDDCACITQLSHLLEHIPATDYKLVKEYDEVGNLKDVKLERVWAQIALMDELWRITENDGQIWITAPYGWSHGFVQDPTHVKPINEFLFEYFDPQCMLYSIYKPKPWRINHIEYVTGGNIIAVLNARKSEEWLALIEGNK